MFTYSDNYFLKAFEIDSYSVFYSDSKNVIHFLIGCSNDCYLLCTKNKSKKVFIVLYRLTVARYLALFRHHWSWCLLSCMYNDLLDLVCLLKQMAFVCFFVWFSYITFVSGNKTGCVIDYVELKSPRHRQGPTKTASSQVDITRSRQTDHKKRLIMSPMVSDWTDLIQVMTENQGLVNSLPRSRG